MRSLLQAHCRVIILSTFYEETINLAKTASPELKVVLYQLLELYTVYWALERLSCLLQVRLISTYLLLLLGTYRY